MSLTDDQIEAKNFQKFYNAILPYLNGSAHSGFTPIGTVISVMGTTAPMNYLACDGTAYNIADYPELAAYFNAQFGSSNFFGGNGTTTFAVPDLRGEFLRGTGTNSHANQGSGAAVGVHQDGTEHIIVYSRSDGGIEIYTTSESDIRSLKVDYDSSATGSGNYKRLILGQKNSTSGGIPYYTSRPTNTSVLYCIASKNIFMDAGMNYSTEEQVVGTWIDGKPIYQKTVSCGALPNNSFKAVAHGISNLEKIIEFNGYALHHNGIMVIQIPNGGDSDRTIYVDRFNENIRIITTGDNSMFTEAYVTVKYTKTTD